MFKSIIILQKGLVYLSIPLRNKALIADQHLVQSGLFRLDFLNKLNHGSVVCGHDMGQSQQVDVCDRAPDFLQLSFADHNGARIGMDVIDTEYCQDIGQ